MGKSTNWWIHSEASWENLLVCNFRKLFAGWAILIRVGWSTPAFQDLATLNREEEEEATFWGGWMKKRVGGGEEGNPAGPCDFNIDLSWWRGGRSLKDPFSSSFFLALVA